MPPRYSRTTADVDLDEEAELRRLESGADPTPVAPCVDLTEPMANFEEEPAPSLAVPRKGRLQKGRSALPETKPPQRKKEGLGRKRPAAAARSESGSDSDAPSAEPKKKSRAATADYSESYKRLVMSHALRLPKSGRIKPTCTKFSSDDRKLQPNQIRRWLKDRGLMVDVLRALQGAGLSAADDVEAMLSAAGVTIPAPLPAPEAYARITGALARVQSVCIHRAPLHRL